MVGALQVSVDDEIMLMSQNGVLVRTPVKDISVVGYDDSAAMAFTGPPLTTSRQSIPAMCNAAVRALPDELAGRPVPRQEYLFQPELIVRGSTGAAPASKRVPVGARRAHA